VVFLQKQKIVLACSVSAGTLESPLMEYTIPKGLFDIVPYEPKEEDRWRTSDRWHYVEQVMRRVASDYGFQEMRTPLFEQTGLFVRGVGESSDIVSKEMYTFLDKAERSMTLRPEGTAPVMRAYVEKHLNHAPGLSKFYYMGPMFRYERPQAGRYRQHHQFGAEAVGIGGPEQDVELIDLLCELYRRLGLKNLKVHINSVGDEASRAAYRGALSAFLKPHFETLSEDSKVRFAKNVLRILDSKDPGDKKVLEGAPSLIDYLSEEARAHFDKLQRLLKMNGISYVIDPKLVRGLDYYNKTVFEVMSAGLSAQNTVGAGGRYDGLLKTFGGPALPSVGFATGIERILQTMEHEKIAFPAPSHPDLFLIPLGEKGMEVCFQKALQLRHLGWRVEIDLSGKKIQHGLQLASALHATYSVVVGSEELAKEQIEVKEMQTRALHQVAWSDLEAFLEKHARRPK
jgi:histidyl-tRNA synthetase